MIDFAAPLQGLNRAAQSFDRAASRIVSAPFAASAAPQDSVDLSTEMVNLLESRNDFSANAKVVHTAEEMSKTLIDMIG